jgi:phosphoribosylanthranilate isomerase
MARIKLCGMTNLDDCEKAADLSVDFIGFVFYRKSKRYVTPEKVRKVVKSLDGRVQTVGVFVEEKDSDMAAVMEYCGLDFAQVYRPSSVANRIRVYRIADAPPDIPEEGLLLFDSYTEYFGGSGRSFDHTILAAGTFLDRSFIAGGIDEQNVREVLRLKPFGVDLVSSVEAHPGKKDHEKMEKFVKEVRRFQP